MEQQKLNALVFVMYNMKLRERTMKRQADVQVDPLLVDHVDSDDEWITEQEEPALPIDTAWLDEGLDVTAIEIVGDENVEEPTTNTKKRTSTRKRARDSGSEAPPPFPSKLELNFVLGFIFAVR